MKVNPREQTQQLAKSSQFVGNSWEEEDHFHAAHRENITRSMVYIAWNRYRMSQKSYQLLHSEDN